MIKFLIKGPIQPKGRPRFGKHGVYTPQTTKSAEEAIGYIAKIAMQGRPPLECLVAVKIEIEIETLSRKKIGQYAKTRADADNRCKLFFDSVNGIVWLDDRQVAKIEYTQRYGPETLAKITVEKLS